MRITAKVLVIAAAAAVAGYLIGPTVVQAAGSVVKIGNSRKASQARVRGHRLWVDTEASTFPCFGKGTSCLDTEIGGVLFTLPAGNDVIGQGAASNTTKVVDCGTTGFGVLASV